MQRTCLLALIGLPAAGKTTFSRWLLSLHQHYFEIVHLCYDDFLQFVSPPADYKTQRLCILQILENLVYARKTSKHMPHGLQSQIKKTSNGAKDVLFICDDNNYYRSMRYKLHQFCKQHSLAYAQIYFMSDLDTCLERNAQRAAPQRIPAHLLQQMCARLEAPNKQQYAWEAHTLTLDAIQPQYSSDVVISFILNVFEHIVEPQVLDTHPKTTHLLTAVHQLDLLLRRRISELLNLESSPTEKRRKAATLNNKRKDILRELKENDAGVVATKEDLSKYVDLLS